MEISGWAKYYDFCQNPKCPFTTDKVIKNKKVVFGKTTLRHHAK